MQITMNGETPQIVLTRKQQQHDDQQQHQKQQHMQQESSSNDDEDESRTSTKPKSNIDDYATTTEKRNFEFALKLGYEEQLIHTALQRLGHDAKQNELLAELIKLSADMPKINTNTLNSMARNIDAGVGVSFNAATNGVGNLRHIVIDGSNVALSHGNNEVFSCRGIRICVDWFRQRGHKDITAFVPNWRKESSRVNCNNYIKDQDILYELEREHVLVFTPSRLLEGKRVACYDDRYILKLATETDGIVVSNDNYRDLLLESSEFRKVVQERLLMYSFVNDRFMPPDDPLGRTGPTLEVFLRTQPSKGDSQQQLCPYGKKCTYGNKCKFRHQTSHLLRMQLTASRSVPLNFNSSNNNNKLTQTIVREQLSRTKSNTIEKVSKPIGQQLGSSNATYNLAASTPNNSNWQQQQQQQHEEQQLSAAFNYKMDLLHSGDDINRHKKLQRQVPSHHMTNSSYEPQQQQQQQHRLLVPTISAPHAHNQNNTHSNNNNSNQHNNSNSNRHQHLTRLPSAPVAPATFDTLFPMSMQPYAYLSASDSRINEELHQSQTREEKRRLLRFHLSSLFPQHQVHAVLQMYPDETDAKTICAAIINLFPNN